MKIVPEGNRFIKEVLEDREYDFIFDHHVMDVVLDVGANIGTFSIWIYPYAQKIYALEPIIDNFNYLAKNIGENNLFKVRPFRLALAGKSGFRMMKADVLVAGEGGWQLDDDGIEEVPCITLSEFLNQEKIDKVDLLKLDVEGAELEIIEAEDFPKDKIETIAGELHYNSNDARDKKIRDLFYKRLDILGYKVKLCPGSHFLAKRI